MGCGSHRVHLPGKRLPEKADPVLLPDLMANFDGVVGEGGTILSALGENRRYIGNPSKNKGKPGSSP